jgi:hypothetical protein
MGLAAWILLTTGNIPGFIVVLAMGFIDSDWTKKNLMKILKALAAED